MEIKQLNMFSEKKAHFADIKNSRRLQGVLEILQDGAEHTTFDIMLKTKSCAVHTDIYELRKNGIKIDCRQNGKSETGRKVFVYKIEN